MADFVSSAAANTVGNLATQYASPYVSYFFDFGKIVEDFKHRRNQLELKRNQVKDDVDEAIRQTEEIKQDVQDWLKRAEKELGEAQNLEDEIERNKCFKWCHNWGWRYCLSEKVAKKTLCISRLLETSDFPRVGNHARLQGIEFLLSNDFMPFQSSKAAFNGIMTALRSEGVNIIGLYGMPGVGKTTLVEEVGKQAREQKLFHKVVIFTVSQTPNINEIQDKIAAILGLEFQTTTDQGVKAEKLWKRLKVEKKILIIVDDVWDRLELKRIGIPFGDEHEGCKILLTTRLQQVCTQMNCQEKFKLDILPKSEAWALFEDNADLKNASPTLNDIAKEVARECNGLPLAIITMARTLKGETIDVWEIVNQRLKKSRHSENQDFCGGIYSKLKISYDYLKGNNSRTCLQMCSFFPEDDEISVEELTMYGIGQGMFHDVYSIEEARREMHVTITNLQKSGLLLETKDVSYVKMHDVVRDFVHWITRKGENMFLVKSGLKEWPRSESLGCYTAISIINSDINTFPDRLELPKLEAFLFGGKGDLDYHMLLGVPSAFFPGMKALKVLVLRRVSQSLEGLQFLPNLQTLQLDRCELRDASSLGNLKKLEILIIDSYVVEEPRYDLMGLTALRLLTLYCPFSTAFSLPNNLFSSLVRLEELYLGLPIKWASREKSAYGASLSELCSLPRLTHLSMQFFSDCIPQNFVFPPLKRYDLAVNEEFSYPNHWHKSSRRLTITNFSLTAFAQLFCNVEELSLKDINNLEYLTGTTKEQGPKSAFNNLVRLTLKNMTCLKELCHGPPPIGFLQKLEFLSINKCPDVVFEIATIKNLKELTVIGCRRLQVLFQVDGLLHTSEEIRAPLQPSITSLHLVALTELRSIWKGPCHHVISLQTLREVNIKCCNKLKSIFSLSYAQTLVHLECLEISNCDGLEQVFDCAEGSDGTEIMHPDHHQLQSLGLRNLISLYLNSLPELMSLWTGPKHHAFSLQTLREVTISRCNKLKSVFSLSLAQTLVYLERLQISNCSILEQVFSCAEERDGTELMHPDHQLQSLGLPKLISLHLDSLPELRGLWTGPNHHVSSLQSLRVVTIRCCNKLNFVFPFSLARSLVHLEGLDVSECDGLEQVFYSAEETDHVEDMAFPQLHKLVLIGLTSLRNFYTENNIVKLPSLKKLALRRCGQLTHFKVGLEVTTMLCELEGFQLYGFKEMICCSKNLTLSKITGCKNLIPDIDPKGLNGLIFLQLHNFGDLECLHDTTEHRQPTNAFSNLVELVMEEMIGLKMFCNNQPPNGFLQKLEKLKITNCMNMASLSPVVGGQNLKEVMIKDCGQLQEIFQVAEVLHSREANQAPLLSNLTHLKLKSLSELRCIWKGLSHSVINLQSLKIIKIRKCNRLRCLFLPSLVESLVHLEELFLQDLPELEQLITELECDVDQEQQVSNKVKEKVVDGQHELFLPSLEYLKVTKCPRLAPFVIQQEVNNQAQVKGLYLSNRQCNSFDILLRQSLPNLEHFTVGNHFHFLQWLIVSNCSKLKSLFSPMLAQSLPYLSHLYIEYCEQLEQIIDKDKSSASSSHGHLQSIFFHSLIEICIEGCSNLKSLFSVSEISLSLSQLLFLTIRGASKLEQVFEHQCRIDIEDTVQEIVLPLLRKLSLEELPRLKSFTPIGYHSSFPHLDALKIEKCPSLTTCFSIDSKLIMHARTKAVGDVPMEGSATELDVMQVSDIDGETTWRVGSDINWSRWESIFSRWQ